VILHGDRQKSALCCVSYWNDSECKQRWKCNMTLFWGVTCVVRYTSVALRFCSSCCTHFQEISWRQQSYLKILTEVPHEIQFENFGDSRLLPGYVEYLRFFIRFAGWVDNLSPSSRDSLTILSYLDYFTSEDKMDTLSVNFGKFHPLRLRKIS